MRRATVTFCSPCARPFGAIVPTSADERARGLQDVPRLADDEGMLFLSETWPQASAMSFWMADVAYPIAMIWLSDGRVAAIEYVQPGDLRTYTHEGVAMLEINLQSAREINLGTPVCLSS